jgi:hypothetical protein
MARIAPMVVDEALKKSCGAALRHAMSAACWADSDVVVVVRVDGGGVALFPEALHAAARQTRAIRQQVRPKM